MALVGALYPLLYAKQVKDPIGVYYRVCKLLGKEPVHGILWVPMIADRLKVIVIPHAIANGFVKKSEHASWSRRCNAVGINRAKLVEVINLLLGRMESRWHREVLLNLLMSGDEEQEIDVRFSVNWLDLTDDMLVS